MSTQPIREALELLDEESKMARLIDDTEAASRFNSAYTAALEAVRAIEEMAKTICGASGHWCARRDDSDEEQEAFEALESIAKEAP